MEAKPEELGRICSNRKDVPFYVLQFCIHANFLSVQLLRRYEFLKNNVCSLFFLSSKIVTATLRAFIEAKPEVLGKLYPYRKDVPFYVLQFCIYANFLSVQLLRHYEFLKK